jgi:putative flippase GtrA
MISDSNAVPRQTSTSLWGRLLRFARSMLVGGVATVTDLSCLEILVRVFEFQPSTAKVFSFLVGTLVQFFGNRKFTFRAQGMGFRTQAISFAAVEAVTLFLHWGLTKVLVEWWLMPMELAYFLISFTVYVGFSYPAWKRIFRAE